MSTKRRSNLSDRPYFEVGAAGDRELDVAAHHRLDHHLAFARAGQQPAKEGVLVERPRQKGPRGGDMGSGQRRHPRL